MKPLPLLLLLVVIACTTKKETQNNAARLDEYLSGQAKHYRFNGNVLVAANGKVILQQSYGYADFDSKRQLNDSSVFELASVSKQFTATGILLLKEKGKLKLTDSLRMYFPELPYPGITLWHLLTHTSGLPDYEEAMNEKWDRDKIAFNSDMIAFLAKEKLPVLFAPGTQWTYSNTAYAILASIIEKVSGQSFKDYMAENIFQPLGMRHTRIYNTRRSLKDTIANYAYGYVYEDSVKKYVLPDSVAALQFVIYLDGIQGDGIVNSTTGDLMKWDRALKNHSLLSEAMQKEMLQEQALVDTLKKSYYGFGVFMEKTELGYLLSHSGGWPGYTTFLARNTDKDETYIILSNNSANSPALYTSMQHIMAGKPVVMPYAHTAIAMDSTAMDTFTGNYKAGNEFTLERKGSKLYRVLPNGSSTEIIPESATKFFYSDGSDRQLEFTVNEKKEIKEAWLITYGIKKAITKMK